MSQRSILMDRFNKKYGGGISGAIPYPDRLSPGQARLALVKHLNKKKFTNESAWKGNIHPKRANAKKVSPKNPKVGCCGRK